MYFVSGRAFRCSFDHCIASIASRPRLLALIRNKCLPVLLYGVEACPMLVRDKRSLEFTVTRSLMKRSQTGSANVVSDCMNFFTSCQ